MTKAERKAAIRERAANAIRDLYHNATPEYPRDIPEEHYRTFDAWLSDAASCEIDYIRDGGAYGRNYRKTLESVAARKFKSEAAQRRYVAHGMRQMRQDRARCNCLDSREHLTNAAWERISEFGKLYQYGRGGRTLAPDDLIRTRGGSSFSVREDYADEMSTADCVDLITVVESFNRFVAMWCAAIPEMWAEYFADNFGGADIEATAELSTTD